MKEFVVTGERTIEFRDYQESPLKPDEVRVKAIVSGIKHGTELTLYTGHTPFVDKAFDPEYRLFMERSTGSSFYPLNLGSWLTGEVVEVGSEVRDFKIGDHVHGPMAHRPTNVAKEKNLYHLPGDMKPETALFTDPTIYALTACHDAEIKVGDNVAVFGLGVLGLIAVQIARLSGAEKVFAVDLFENRLNLAKDFGADGMFNPRECDAAFEIKKATDKKGVDVAIEISGSYSALDTAVKSVHVCGTIVAASYYKGERALNLGGEWHHNRPTLKSSMPVWGMPHRCYPMWDLKRIEKTAIHLLETGRVVTDPIISKRYHYEDAIEAYQFIDKHPDQTIKTLLDYK